MRLQPRFTPHTVTVRDLVAAGGMGSKHAAPRVVEHVWVVDERQAITDASGAEVISNTQVSTNVDEIIPLGSLVTVWKGEPGEREAKVVKIGVFRHRRLPQSQTLYLT
ncbi:hypothetical protein [Microbacterium foliorum]|uniref:hypothetical protein n=1 Tax=Microbacterium foliorum TaxID=104336 RepID=UPI0009A03FED|nr:hypothetical protein [Microbacterium foliorum]AQY02042.1 hypothetical protein B2G67_11595 [Microbacterium foliorum]